MDLGKLVTSQVSAEYVEPLFPKEGEPVSVALDFSPLVEVGTAMCVSNHKGLNWRHNPARREGGRLWFKLEGAWDPELLRWYFVFEAGGRFHYYSKRGVTTYPPAAKDHFRLKPGFDSPDWVAGATCYQIFPDRFANGDESNDVHDGDYVYDGHAVQARSFSDTPEDYSKAHCLDFYNGDLKGIEDHLDHLESIGVSCIYLNPIVDSRTMHRFDAVDYFHVDPKLGGDEALSSLIARCHERGIRVVVDISINHSSTENAWFIKAKADPSSEEAGFYYYRDSQKHEIDLLILRDGRLSLIECKAGMTYDSTDVKAFSRLEKSDYEVGPSCIICLTDRAYPLKPGVYALPISSI